jgi:undecaprenyl-diphosphatase
VLLSRFVPGLTGRAFVVVVGVAVAAAVGLSRVFLRAHELSDVVGGWSLAATIYAVCGLVAMVVVHLGNNRVRR